MTELGQLEWLSYLTWNHTPYQILHTFSRAKVVKFFYIEPLVSYHCAIESCQSLWLLSCEEAIQTAYERSMALLRFYLNTYFKPETLNRGGMPQFVLDTMGVK
jgi:hypothetical protein